MAKRRQLSTDEAFGEALMQIRRERNISQEEFARQAGLDRTYVSSLERGLKSPTLRTLMKCSAVLQVMPSEMMRHMEQYLQPWSKKP